MNKQVKTVGAVASLALVAGMGTIVAVSADQAPTFDSGSAPVSAEGSSIQGETRFASVPRVEGVFSYDQNAVSSNVEISSVFRKAAATLCQSLPKYGASLASQVIRVGGDVQEEFSATVDELSDQGGTSGHIMACACATNGPGGGAIVNANVEGVSLASIAQRAGA